MTTYESLLIGGVIEILNGGYTTSNLATCPGAEFGLGGQTGQAITGDWSLGTPTPVVDLLATLLGDGEIPIGRRASNRTIVLPVIIRAPDGPTLAGARETLFNVVNAPAWELVWTRPGGSPFTFDCFRAQPTVVTYSLEDADALISRVLLTFQALPYGRSSSEQILAFASPSSTSSMVANPVTLDTYASVSSSTQPTWWAHSTLGVVGANSAWWDWDITDGKSAPLYTHTITPVSISGLSSLTFWVGLASPENYKTWRGGRVHFSVTLTDNGSHVLAFGGYATVSASNKAANPVWNFVSLAIPQGSSTFNYASVGAYSLQMWRIVDSGPAGAVKLDADVYLNGLQAAPTTVAQPPSERGTVYNLLGIVGSAHAPIDLEFQQVAAASSQTVTFSAPGNVSWVPPPGVTSVQVEKMGAGGRGGPLTAAGHAGGGNGGEYTRNGAFGCVPGVVINGYVGAGATPAGGGYISRLGDMNVGSKTQSSFTHAIVTASTGGNSLLATICIASGATVSSVTDTQGNTYIHDYTASTGSALKIEVWRCASAAALSTSDSITWVLSGPSGDGGSLVLDEYSPLGAPDVTNTGNTTGTSLSVAATATSSDLIMHTALVVFFNTSPSVAGPFSSGGIVANNGLVDTQTGYFNAPSAGSHSAAWSWTGSHTATAVILGYPAAASPGGINGQDTWFGADDTTRAHGGLGVAANTSTGAAGMTGTSTDPVHFAGGAGATGTASGGGGGGSSGGSAATGNNGAVTAGGAAPTGGAAGGNGGASGAANPGSAGAAPGGGGGGAFSTGAVSAAGASGNGQIILTYTTTLTAFQTMIAHMPGPHAPQNLVPLVSVGGGQDAPDGREYAVPDYAAGVNAAFQGTYTVILTNYTWDTPASSRTVAVVVHQYEYPGGPAVTSTVSRAVVPNTDIVNGIVIIDNMTLPVKQIPPDNTTAYFTVGVTSTDASDLFMDVLFIDTEGQLALVNVGDVSTYTSMWVNAPQAGQDIGLVSASAYDRNSAMSVMQYAIVSGGPMSVDPEIPNNWILAYAVEGQPAVGVSYLPRYWVDDPGTL